MRKLVHVSLLVVDHPADMKSYPDERFASKPPSQDLLAFRDIYPPSKATDHRGRDMLSVLRARDRNIPPGFIAILC